MVRTQVYAALLAAGLVLTACNGADDAVGDARAKPKSSLEARSSIDHAHVPIATSSWRPGDGGRGALILGSLHFSRQGCPLLGTSRGVVWPAGFTSIVEPDGEQVIVTADGREIAAGDTVVGGGAAAGGRAGTGIPCIKPGTSLTLIESEVRIVRGDGG